MPSQASVLEAVLQRDRLLLVAALVAVVALAWGWILAGAGMETSAVAMTAMSNPSARIISGGPADE